MYHQHAYYASLEHLLDDGAIEQSIGMELGDPLHLVGVSMIVTNGLTLNVWILYLTEYMHMTASYNHLVPLLCLFH